MNSEREAVLLAVTSFVQLRLDHFSGLSAETTKSHIIGAAGPVFAEGFAGGERSLWMTVHQLNPTVRLTAWYELANDAPEPGVSSNHLVVWIERPIAPSQVAGLLNLPGSHRPARAGHLVAWTERGLCLRFSQRSRQPTTLFAYAHMNESEFDQSLMAMCD